VISLMVVCRMLRQDRGRSCMPLGAFQCQATLMIIQLGPVYYKALRESGAAGQTSCRKLSIMFRCYSIEHVCCSQLEASHCMACFQAVCALVSLSCTYVQHNLRS